MIPTEIKTDDRLLRALQEAATRPTTQEELHEQRVSFVYGFMGHTSTMTRDEVRRLVERQEGRA